MAEAQAQPYQDDFLAVYLTMLTGTIVIPQGSVDVHQSSESSSGEK
jgi:hypothetical protein